MSPQLTFSAIVSVAVMSLFVLFNGVSVPVASASDALTGPISVSAPALPSPGDLLPAIH